MCTSLLNPWLGVSFKTPVAPVDISVISSLSHKKLSDLELRILPEPFHGDPDANVYLLNGNPGLDPLDLTFINNPVMQSTFTNIYSHSKTDFLWLEKTPSIVNGNGLEHKAYDWWKKRLSKVVCAKPVPRLFCVELFPYHSRNTFQFPSLPSDKYANSLILNAMQSNKLIIIMRCRKGWIKRIPQLATYQNCICLNTPRCAYISPTNTSKSGMSWNTIISYF